jgi:hypothetical protein
MEAIKKIRDLTVQEFKEIMQQCFDADREALRMREQREMTIRVLVLSGMSYMEAITKADEFAKRGWQQ